MLETSSETAAALEANVRGDMEQVRRARQLGTKVHKDPFEQAVVYNANNDVYELFKVSKPDLARFLAPLEPN